MATPSVPVAPVAAPAPAATSAPAVPAVSSTPAATPEAPAAATPAAPATPAGPPKNTDFPNTREGQIEFLAKLKDFEKNAPAKPEAAVIADSLGAQPGEKKPEPEQKPAGEAKPEGEVKPEAPAKPDPTAVPKAIADLLDAKPDRKAFVDADPELKGILFGNARRLAAIEPIAQIVPTVEDANFMAEHTAAMVGLQTASMRMIDMPETAPQVLDMLDQQFLVIGQDGKPVVDAAGKPTYAEDRRPFLDAIVNREVDGYRQQFTTEMNTLKAKLASGVYPNEAAKASDQVRLERLEMADLWTQMWDQIRTGEIFKQDAPEIPADATPEFKTWAEAEKKRIAEENEKLEASKKGASKEQRQAAKTQFNDKVRGTYAGHVGKIIGEQLKQHTDAGGYIPEFYLQEKHVDTKTGKDTNTPALAARIFMTFENELLRAGSRTLKEITQHELLPPTAQTEEVRAKYYQRKASELLPGIIEKEIKRIENLVKIDQDKQGERLKTRQAAAQPEPSSGAGKTGVMSEEQKMQTAEANAKRDPGFPNASPAEKQARILTQYHRL